MDNPRLTAQDYCDRCGAQAQARTVHEAGQLLWCGHHFKQHRKPLTPFLVFMTPEIAMSIKAPVHT